MYLVLRRCALPLLHHDTCGVVLIGTQENGGIPMVVLAKAGKPCKICSTFYGAQSLLGCLDLGPKLPVSREHHHNLRMCLFKQVCIMFWRGSRRDIGTCM
jgi:hypothetical protein